MMRVAWHVPTDTSWIAGLNYFRNLAHAIRSIPDRTIEPVVIGDPSALPWPLNECEGIPDIVPRRPAPRWWLYGAERTLLQNGGAVARHLKKHRIDLLSHSAWLGRRTPVPAMCWIPDFQHHHLPRFFSAGELRHRNWTHRAVATSAQALVVSSTTAKRDFERRYPRSEIPVRVLRFVAPATEDGELPGRDEVLAKHNIEEPFLHVPNQLWAHKNHDAVLSALRILRDRGNCPLVIATGRTDDYRDPTHAPAFFDRLKDSGLEERFRFLGLAPYKDVATLMRASIAIINPSLFEGWSTTVEEAKSLGKRLLLSDIPVHREQNPSRGIYFDPKCPAELADRMQEIVRTHDESRETAAAAEAARELPGRMRDFGQTYQRIVTEAVGDSPR